MNYEIKKKNNKVHGDGDCPILSPLEDAPGSYPAEILLENMA